MVNAKIVPKVLRGALVKTSRVAHKAIFVKLAVLLLLPSLMVLVDPPIPALADVITNPTHTIDASWTTPHTGDDNTVTSTSSDISPLLDPSPDGYFYASEFYFSKITGYMGLQANGVDSHGNKVPKSASITIYGATDSSPASGVGTSCENRGEGKQCNLNLPFNWTPGHTYRFSINLKTANDSHGNEIWSSNFTDTTTSQTQNLGTLSVATSQKFLSHSQVTFHERFAGPTDSCSKIQPSFVTFSNVMINGSTATASDQFRHIGDITQCPGFVDNYLSNNVVYSGYGPNIQQYDPNSGTPPPTTTPSPTPTTGDSIDDLLTPFFDPNAASSSSCSVSGSIALLMEAIAIHESGGVANTPPNGTSASGKYQIQKTTWQGLIDQTGYTPAKQFAEAYQAPEEVQDAVVYLAYASQVAKGYNAFQIAMSWYGGASVINDIAGNFNTVPRGNVQSYGQYGNEIVEFMQAGKALDSIAISEGDSPRYHDKPLASIPVNAQSAPDFTSDLAKLGNIPPLTVATYNSDGTKNGSSSVGDSTTCSGNPSANFVFYSQYDSRWANHPIYSGGGRTIATSGCGPTSAAMVVATLADSSITPDKTGDYMTQNGGYSDAGATTAGLAAVVQHWGLKTSSLGSTDQAINVIKNGGLVIAGGTGQSPFTSEGHVVVLRAVDSNGKFLIGNPAPNTQTSTDQPFSPQQLQAAGLSYMIGVTK